MKKQRLVGIDVARALAVMGMIIVNFKVVLGEHIQNHTDQWVYHFAAVFNGKASATFVVLAGMGIALMSRRAIDNDDKLALRNVRQRLGKRAIFLFVVGLAFIPIWPADILHFYGVYMLCMIVVLGVSNRLILILSAIAIMMYPLLFTVMNYDIGWDFESLDYLDFWTPVGFVRHLFFNGFHPVVPWVAFMLVGYWFGRQNLHDKIFIKKMLWVSGLSFIVTQISSALLIQFLLRNSTPAEQVNPTFVEEVIGLVGTQPMPPLPLYMLSGVSIALFVICACIVLAKRFDHHRVTKALTLTGQLALTFYAAHVIIGMGIIESINPEKIGTYPVSFSVTYAVGFSLFCVIFALLWRQRFDIGPLEWLMRKLTD